MWQNEDQQIKVQWDSVLFCLSWWGNVKWNFWSLATFKSKQGYFLNPAGAGQAICQGHRVRHSYTGSQPGPDVPKVLASCDSVMRVSCSEGGPRGQWNLILAISAISASANYDFILLSISSVLSRVVQSNSLSPAPAAWKFKLHNQEFPSHIQMVLPISTISFVKIKIFLLLKK